MQLMNDNSQIGWWNTNRKIANRAITAYNEFLCEGIQVKDFLYAVKLSYLELDKENCDYSEVYDEMIKV